MSSIVRGFVGQKVHWIGDSLPLDRISMTLKYCSWYDATGYILYLEEMYDMIKAVT